MKLIDSHCHLNDDSLYEDRFALIKEAKEEGVSCLVVIGWDLESSKKAVGIAHEFDGVYAAVGFHPENIDGVESSALKDIEELAKDPKVIAIGEIGLDYHWFKEEEHRKRQKEWFVAQIELANKLGLPVSIHARDASNDTLLTLKEHPVINSGVLHCYSGSVETMRELSKLGYYFGFDGPITFKNAKEPKEVVKEVDESRLLFETDSPYLAPTPFRGKTNHPAYVKYVYETAVELRGGNFETIADKVAENFESLFRVKL